MMTRLFGLLMGAGLLACDNVAKPTTQPAVYYDVASFVKAQIDLLTKEKLTVSKAMVIKGQRQTKMTTDVNWVRELELFTQADINKPAFRGSYAISRPDSLTYWYTLRPGEKLTVQSLSVHVDPLTHLPRQIEALLTTANPLYHSERHILLESGPGPGNRWQVRHYRMNGFQQLTFFGKNDFAVEGLIR